MAVESQGSQSVSTFLRSYSPDVFEWEKPDYNPRSCFIWSKPLGSLPCGSLSRPNEKDAEFSDVQSSSDSESLSDMSISLSGIASGHYSAMPPRMSRARNILTSAACSIVPNSDSSSLSDMSISSAERSSSDVLVEVEDFAQDVPLPTVYEWHKDTAPHARFSCFLRDSSHCVGRDTGDDRTDGEAVARLLEWTTYLFETVASSALDYSIRPGNDDVSPPRRSDLEGSRIISATEEEETHLMPCTKDPSPDICPYDSSPVVSLNRVHHVGVSRPIRADPLSILMPGCVDYDVINPEQPTTAKPVCMWGRRLERIPKVRLAGQKEAVYCFDSRKQRQKQKCGNTSNRRASDNLHSEEPTRIFYRARPLCTPFVRQDLPATPVDAVKIMQGQVLLQNITPVHFNSVPSQFCIGGHQTFQRLPFTSRTNDAGQPRRMGYATQPPHVKKMPGRGFL